MIDRRAKDTFPVCISLGPGDAGLITIKALAALKTAEVIYTPATQKGEALISRAADILREIGVKDDKIQLFSVPMKRDRAFAKEVYNNVAKEIATQSEKGVRIAFVAEGDSGFYSSVHYISDKLEELGVSVTHIAGIPAFIACGALAGIHVVKQNEPLSVYPSEVTVNEIYSDLHLGKSIVLMKLSKQNEEIKEALKALDNAHFYYFENVGIPEKEYYTSDRAEILNRDFPYFSLMIIKNKDDD